MGFLGTLIGAGAGYFLGPAGGLLAGASLGSGVDASMNQAEANSANSQQAQANRDFQERMSSTSYQRGVKDMEAAGLNPMLAYSQGGASSPGGSQATMQAKPTVVNSGSAAQALTTMKVGQDILESQARTDQARADADRIRSVTLDQGTNLSSAWSNIDLQRAQAQRAIASIMGDQYDSKTKQAVFEAMFRGGGFGAEVTSKVSAADLAQLEVAKQRIVKIGYELAGPVVEGLKPKVGELIHRGLNPGTSGGSWDRILDDLKGGGAFRKWWPDYFK